MGAALSWRLRQLAEVVKLQFLGVCSRSPDQTAKGNRNLTISATSNDVWCGTDDRGGKLQNANCKMKNAKCPRERSGKGEWWFGRRVGFRGGEVRRKIFHGFLRGERFLGCGRSGCADFVNSDLGMFEFGRYKAALAFRFNIAKIPSHIACSRIGGRAVDGFSGGR